MPNTSTKYKTGPKKGIISSTKSDPTPRMFKGGESVPHEVIEQMTQRELDGHVEEGRLIPEDKTHEALGVQYEKPIGGTVPGGEGMENRGERVTMRDGSGKDLSPKQPEPGPLQIESTAPAEAVTDISAESNVKIQDSVWNLEPNTIVDKSYDELRVMIAERDPDFDFNTVPDKDTAIGVLSQHSQYVRNMQVDAATTALQQETQQPQQTASQAKKPDSKKKE